MANESQKIGKENASKMRTGRCGSCGLKMLFWAKDEEIVTFPNCGASHEVERGEALNLTTNETVEVA